ncbi:hypothetical protein GCM10027160_23860 [Streptomyces calidiresistens]|uniref:Uncharacterized protein n=1 Tax=Streptomyces calidiresistens TaxID=1485586 RepID=A0A7W3T7Z9_9ACTN|nr:hypothetical protein [Streptomyces calidiresistens]MBB0232572.1 hypothetical protein [Streptomyces calidiresistens]
MLATGFVRCPLPACLHSIPLGVGAVPLGVGDGKHPGSRAALTEMREHCADRHRMTEDEMEQAGITVAPPEPMPTAWFRVGRAYADASPYTAPELTRFFEPVWVGHHPTRGTLRAVGWMSTGSLDAPWHMQTLDGADAYDGWTDARPAETHTPAAVTAQHALIPVDTYTSVAEARAACEEEHRLEYPAGTRITHRWTPAGYDEEDVPTTDPAGLHYAADLHATINGAREEPTAYSTTPLFPLGTPAN